MDNQVLPPKTVPPPQALVLAEGSVTSLTSTERLDGKKRGGGGVPDLSLS